MATTNSTLFILKPAAVACTKVPREGRLFYVEERAALQGVVYDTLKNIGSTSIHVKMLGNMLPTNIAGVILRQVLKVMAKWEQLAVQPERIGQMFFSCASSEAVQQEEAPGESASWKKRRKKKLRKASVGQEQQGLPRKRMGLRGRA